MTGFSLLILLVLSSAFISGCSSTGIKRSQKYLVAVARPINLTRQQLESSMLEDLRSQLIHELHDSGRARLIEREYLDEILKEQRLAQTGLLKTRDAMRLGKLAGAQAILIAQVSSIDSRQTENKAGSAMNRTLTLEVNLDARLVDVDSGEILATARAIEDAEGTENSFRKRDVEFKSGNANPGDLLRSALKSAGLKLARDISDTVPLRD